jgi:aminomethyltransferase
MLKHTALFEEHKRLGGRMVDFGGWELPVQYSGVLEEHLACRASGGLFDVSHMGEIHIEGKDSESFLNYLVTNNVSKTAIGQAQYTVMCHESGGIVDDLVIYRRGTDRFLMVVNASNTEKDFNHIQKIETVFRKSHSDLKITNESHQYTQIAIQGRNALEILSELTSAPLHSLKNYWFLENTLLNSIPTLFGRTGYTGEDGFEIYIPWNTGPEVWKALLEKGIPKGIKPCGLAARDTLRLEMKYPLYGHELSDQTNPLEAGLSWVVKLDKGDFVGRAALLAAQKYGMTRQLVGIKTLERGIPRQDYSIYDAEGINKIGEITSGTHSPSLKTAIGVGYVNHSHHFVGSKITIDIRGAKLPAEIVPTPFYKKPY